MGIGAAAAAGLTEGVKENAEEASEGALEVKERPRDPEANGASTPMEKGGGAEVAHVVGTEKLKLDDGATEDAGAAGATLNGAAKEDATGAAGVEAAAGERPMVGNVARADGNEAGILGG